MSLINEALKKAQRLRNEDAADPSAPAAAGGGRIAKRGKAHSANTTVLIGSGAVVLVVLSVVATVYLINRSSQPTPRLAASSPSPDASVAPSSAPEPSPPVKVPGAITPPIPSAPVESSPAQPATPTSPTSGTSALSSSEEPSPGPTPSPVTPPRAIEQTPPAPPAPPAPDERVTAYVEAIRVTGIRSSGSESRVLMNDRVFRVNDVVDRTLGVRLIKVAADSLTFSDPKGFAYVKNF